jgi:hypothetical protein
MHQMTDRASEAALADPATLRAWRGEQRRTLTTLILWTLCLPGYAVLAAVAVDLDWVSRLAVNICAVPVVLVIVGGLVAGSLRREQLGRMRGVLETYPWQELPPIGKSHPAGMEYFQLPDPDEPAKRVRVAFRRFGLGRRWQRAVTEARSTGFAVAGDPRFACVVALPGLRELLVVRPQHAYTVAPDTRPDRVSEASWKLAQAAGTTAPPSDEEQRRKLLYSLWRGFRNRKSA